MTCRRGKLDVGQRMALVLKQLERPSPRRTGGDAREQRERFLATLEPDSTGWIVQP